MKKIIFALCVIFIGCKGTSQEKEATKLETKKKEQFKVTKTEAEWRKQLTDMQFYVLRKAGKENPGSSELLNNK